AKQTVPIYAFYHSVPDIEFDQKGSPKYTVYACCNCRSKQKQGLSGTDAASTSVLHRHAKKCWGDEAVKAAQDSKNISRAREAVQKFGSKKQSMLTAALRTVKGWTESFSTTPPSKESVRVVTAHWVAECARPFRVVQDRGYRWLQKEGWPDQYVPSKETVSRDVKNLFEKTKQKIATELQDYDGKIPIAIDCWTSPNH
ncbi:hypothetical protein BT96DRAFT_747958, partial [Gymnopus androsaceus JB14]